MQQKITCVSTFKIACQTQSADDEKLSDANLIRSASISSRALSNCIFPCNEENLVMVAMMSSSQTIFFGDALSELFDVLADCDVILGSVESIFLNHSEDVEQFRRTGGQDYRLGLGNLHSANTKICWKTSNIRPKYILKKYSKQSFARFFLWKTFLWKNNNRFNTNSAN